MCRVVPALACELGDAASARRLTVPRLLRCCIVDGAPVTPALVDAAAGVDPAAQPIRPSVPHSAVSLTARRERFCLPNNGRRRFTMPPPELNASMGSEELYADVCASVTLAPLGAIASPRRNTRRGLTASCPVSK